MKKQLMIGLLATFASAGAMAGDGCNGDNTRTPTVLENAADGSKFVRVDGQKIKCSANVIMTYDQSATALWVGAASKKGKNSFKGNTAGGAVKVHTACASSSECTTTDVTAAETQAQTDSSSG